ncbi:MAG: methylmalonyl-CoA epimerase [Bacteroidota bacterium]
MVRDSFPTHIEHIGIAVRSLEESIPAFEKLLGLSCGAVETVEDQRVKTAIFRLGETRIELLESTDPEGPIGKFIASRGEGLHHIALAVPDVRLALDRVAGEGLRLIDRDPRPGAEGLQIAFLHPRSTAGVLTELCGKK